MRLVASTIAAISLLAACSTPPASPASTSGGTLERAGDSGQADRVGPADGALKPDGVKDLSFVAQVEGPVRALFLVSVDDGGKPNGAFQADNLTGAAESPKELGARPGSGTAGLGVVENDAIVNGGDGSLPELKAGSHRLVLYVAPAPSITSGTRLRIFVQKPDLSLMPGGIVTN